MPKGDPPTRFPRRAARRVQVNDSVQVVQDNLDRIRDHYDKHGPHGGEIEWEDVGSGGGGVTPLSFQAAIGNLAATRDLVGYWRLGDGGSPFLDTSGKAGGPRNFVKIPTGVAMTDSVPGALPAADDDGAVEFNTMGETIGDYLKVADSSLFNGSGERTALLWIKPMGTPTGLQYVFGTMDQSNGGWMIALNGNPPVVLFQRLDAGGNATATGEAITAGLWTFVAVTWSPAGGVSIYLNGVLVHSDTVVMSMFPVGTLVLGRRNDLSVVSSRLHYRGAVDEASFWNVRLTLGEIETLARSGGL